MKFNQTLNLTTTDDIYKMTSSEILITKIINDNLGVWEADDEDDLLEEITTAAGWCIKSLNYEIQLK